MNLTEGTIIFNNENTGALSRWRMVCKVEGDLVHMYVGSKLAVGTAMDKLRGYVAVPADDPKRETYERNMAQSYKAYLQTKSSFSSEAEIAAIKQVIARLENQPTATKENVMSNTILENKTLVFGVDTRGISLETALELLSKIEKQRAQYQAIVVRLNSKKIAALIKDLDEAERVVVEALDAK
jgi:hypothetical protein